MKRLAILFGILVCVSIAGAKIEKIPEKTLLKDVKKGSSVEIREDLEIDGSLLYESLATFTTAWWSGCHLYFLH